jgi:hypothetical protein
MRGIGGQRFDVVKMILQWRRSLSPTAIGATLTKVRLSNFLKFEMSDPAAGDMTVASGEGERPVAYEG